MINLEQKHKMHLKKKRKEENVSQKESGRERNWERYVVLFAKGWEVELMMFKMTRVFLSQFNLKNIFWSTLYVAL